MAAADLALETSRRAPSLALGLGPRVLAEELGEKAHASDLLPRIQDLLEHGAVGRQEGRLLLRALFVGLGPGSYTGLRVGIATALGLSRASDAPLYGLSSFDVLAFAELLPGEEGTVAMDARGGRFYAARYRRTADDVEVLEAPATCQASELGELCARSGPILAQVGLAETAGLAAGPRARLRSQTRPSARALLQLGRARLEAGRLAPSSTLEPLYLQPFGKPAPGGARPPHAGR